MKDLETKCKADFDCTIAELPGFIGQLKTEAETALSNAEVILGLKSGTVKQTLSQVCTDPIPAPAKKSSPKPVSLASPGYREQDNDGILG